MVTRALAIVLALMSHPAWAGSGVELSGVDPKEWNPIGAKLTIKMRRARFKRDERSIFNSAAKSDLVIILNDDVVPNSKVLLVSPTTVQLMGPWKEGKNHLEILAAGEISHGEEDTGALETELYMGSRSVSFEVLDENGKPTGVPVTLQFEGTGGFEVKKTSKNGKVTFDHLSTQGTYFAYARDFRNYMSPIANVSMPSFKGNVVKLQLKGFGKPSTVDNNDLSKGTEGWEGDMDSVRIVPHQE